MLKQETFREKSKKMTKTTNPSDVLSFIEQVYEEKRQLFSQTDARMLCSALAYQKILVNHDIDLPLENILETEGQDYLGKLGTKDEFEWASVFGFMRLHAILHDAYGRVHNKYNKIDRGYAYALEHSPEFIKSGPLFGHITGIFFCLTHRLNVKGV